jgi:hypothetical protein
MATTNSRVVVPFVPGAERVTVTDVTFDSSYPTGGESVTAADLGLTSVTFAITSIKTAGTGSVTEAFYVTSTGLLKAYTAAAEVANATDLSAVTAQIVAFGK